MFTYFFSELVAHHKILILFLNRGLMTEDCDLWDQLVDKGLYLVFARWPCTCCLSIGLTLYLCLACSLFESLLSMVFFFLSGLLLARPFLWWNKETCLRANVFNEDIRSGFVSYTCSQETQFLIDIKKLSVLEINTKFVIKPQEAVKMFNL